jgi:hypothetical protein
MADILKNIAPYYPQASAAGGSARMRDNINEINRVED